jgi:adenylyltransferase/sulfurtransferase
LDPHVSQRYARHLSLPGVGPTGQQRLLDSSVAIIGAGGLGSPALLYLAAAGVGRIGVFDDDRVERSNLQRQVLFDERDLGRPKVEAAADRLRALNPGIVVEPHPVAIRPDNALELLAPYDVWLDGTDRIPARYLLSDAAEILGRPLVYGAIHRFDGQVSVFAHRGGPTYRDLFPTPPAEAPSCADAGVLGVLPGVIGALQATEVLKLLLDLGETLSGRVLLYDARTLAFTELRLDRDPDRPVPTALHPSQPVPGDDPMAFDRIDVHTAKKRMDEGWAPFVLDVRKQNELDIVKFDFMDRQHPHETVASIAGELPKDRDILVTCRSGGRSAMAATVLSGLGFTRLFNLEGGITGWAREIDPSMPTY